MISDMFPISTYRYDVCSFTENGIIKSKYSSKRQHVLQRIGEPYHWMDEPYNATHGEMALWRAVIMQAVQDALSKSNSAEARYHKNEALHWLTGTSKHFITVCLNAGLNPEYVRKRVKKSLASPNAWRAAAGTGARYIQRKNMRERDKKKGTQPIKKTPMDSALTEPPSIITGPW